jgi:RNA polymerase sigma factor (sigma-70 family)
MNQIQFQPHLLQVLVPPSETMEPESFWAQAPDDELIAVFVRSRSRDAMETLVRRHGPMVGNLIGRMLSKNEDREEAFQATFIVLLKSASRIRKRASIGSFLYGVAFRIAKRVRQRRSDEFLKRVADGNAITCHVSNDDPGPFELLAQRLQLEALDEELQRLPESMRAAIVAHYYSGRSVPQIADGMQLSISAVEGRIKRGKQLLRNRLAIRGVSLSATFAAIAQIPSPVSVEMIDHWCHEIIASGTSFESPGANTNLSNPSFQQLLQGELSMQLTHRASWILWTCGICALAAVGLGILPSAKDGSSLSSHLAIGSASGTELETEVNMQTASVPAQPAGQTQEKTQAEPGATNGPGTTNSPAKESVDSKKAAQPVVVWTQPTDLPAWLKGGSSEDSKTEMIREALREVVEEVSFNEMPLAGVVAALGKKLDFDLKLDEKSLEEEGLTPDEPITLELKSMSLRNALYHILEPLHLAHEIDHDVLVVRSQSTIKGQVRTYDLSVILPDNSTAEQLMQIIERSIEPDSWDAAGGNSTCDVFGSLLVVRAPDSIHEQIEELLRLLSKQSKEHIRPSRSNRPANGPPGMGGMM